MRLVNNSKGLYGSVVYFEILTLQSADKKQQVSATLSRFKRYKDMHFDSEVYRYTSAHCLIPCSQPFVASRVNVCLGWAPGLADSTLLRDFSKRFVECGECFTCDLRQYETFLCVKIFW